MEADPNSTTVDFHEFHGGNTLRRGLVHGFIYLVVDQGFFLISDLMRTLPSPRLLVLRFVCFDSSHKINIQKSQQQSLTYKQHHDSR